VSEARLSLSDLVGSIFLDREQLSLRDPAEYSLTYPGTAASENQLLQLESSLGFSLDMQHRQLLATINGWPDILSDISVLSTAELGVGDAWERVSQLLGLYYSESIPEDFPLVGELFPIAVSRYQNDVFAIWRNGPLTRGGRPVIWIANDEIERFDNLEQMLLFVAGEVKKSLFP